jgi:orotate phosphoribosyltransferase
VTPQAEPVLELFRSTGAYLQGHFRLTSGLHSPEYLQCALVLQHPEHAERLGRLLAGQLKTLAGRKIDVVVSPALGGVVIGHEVARALGTRFLFTERDAATKQMALRRGFSVTPGETAVVIEDVVTTGGSTRDVIDSLRAAGAEVLAAGSIIDRSGGTADVGTPRVALATLNATVHQPDACPLCQAGVPVVKPGSRPA